MKKNNDFHLQVPGGETTVLLHTCCAPCSSAIIEAMLKDGITPVIYYCNPNIYPLEEYEIRKNECTRYAQALGLEIVDADYDHERWLEEVKGLENEPERGGRCLKCFKVRLLRTAQYAAQRGIKVITTTLASSRWKSLDQINEAGRWACQQVVPPDGREGRISAAPLTSARCSENIEAVTVPDPNLSEWSVCPTGAVGDSRLGVDMVPPDGREGRISAAPLTSARCSENIEAVTVPDPNLSEWSVCPTGAVGDSRLGVDMVPPDGRVIWWNHNWRKNGLQERRLQIIKEYDFYNQLYCGCEFSMHRNQSTGLPSSDLTSTTQFSLTSEGMSSLL